MTELLERPETSTTEPGTIEKVSIVISKGSLEGIYPGLIMANGARMDVGVWCFISKPWGQY